MLRGVTFLILFTLSYQHEDDVPLREKDVLTKNIPSWAPPINSEHRIPDVLPRRVLLLRHVPLWENRPEEKDFSLLGRPTLDRYGGAAETQGRRFTDNVEGYGTSDPNAVCPSPPYIPCVSKAEANSRARRCCENDKSVPAGCYPLCSIHVSVPVLAKYVTEGKCPWSAMGNFLSCLAEKKDLRECCKFKKMPRLCQDFCNPTGHIPPFTKEIKACEQWFDELTDCFHAGMTPIY